MSTTKYSTLSRQVCRLLADGVPRSAKQIAEAFGLSDTQASDVMVLLKATNRIKRNPVQYSITDTGKAFGQREAKVSKGSIQHNRDYRARERAKKGLPPVPKKPDQVISTASIVEQAIAMRPALDSVWSA